LILICVSIVPIYAVNSDAVFLNQETSMIVKNSKLYISRRYELQINNRQGEEYAEITIPYSKIRRVSKIEAYIKDNSGIIIKKLKSGDVKERSAVAEGNFYDDNFVKEFTLLHNKYPYTIFYSYQLEEDAFFQFDYWSPCLILDVPTLNATLNVEVPKDYKIAYTSRFVDSMKVDTAEATIKYVWKAAYLNQIEPEKYAPDKSEFVPSVDIVPEKFKYDQSGSFSTWKSYGSWESSLLDGLNELPENEKAQINSLISEVKDDKEKIRILYHYLQDATRYINISIQTGGMKPYSASYVANNKYGDCKALSNYFRSVLNYIGIPSFYTNVYAGQVINKINRDFPSMQFNHVFLCVPLAKDTLWMECTTDGPFNYSGTFTQHREAFMIDKETSRFTWTPALSTGDVLETRTIQVLPGNGNELTATFHTVLRGEAFESLSELSRSVSESKKSQIIHRYLIESGFEMIDFKLLPANRDSAFITLNYTAKADNLFKKYGNELLIPMIPFEIPAFKDPKNRKYPVQLDFPINKLDSIDYRMPVGYMISALPKEQILNTVFGRYTLRFQQENNRIKVIKSFILNAGNYPLTQYKEFFKFIRTVYDFENSSYIVTKKQE
jgi:hypothetical protein